MLKRNRLRLMSLAVCTVAAVAVVCGAPAAFSAPGALKVTIDYKGAGKVNADHKVWVWVFDNPAIDASSTPIAADSLAENGGTLNFENLPDQVYIAVAFDEKGGYDGTAGPPPSGTPVAIHGQPGAATAITTGADATVTVTFDDSVRMP